MEYVDGNLTDKHRKSIKEYEKGHTRKDDNTRVYLRILNRDTEIPRIWVEERPRILRIVTAWTTGKELCREDQDLLDSLRPIVRTDQIEGGPVVKESKRQSLQPWQFPYEEIRAARGNGNTRDVPRVCKYEGCEIWFVQAPRGEEQTYCLKHKGQSKIDWEHENQVDRTLDKQQQRKNKREAEAAEAEGNRDRLMQVVDNKEECPEYKEEKN